MPHKQTPLVIITRKLPDDVEKRMGELFTVECNLDTAPLSRAALEDAVKRATVLVTTLSDEIDATLLAAAGPQLKLIANYGVGVDHIDVAAAAARGISITNTPNVLDEDTADMTMALMLAVPRRLVEGAQMMATNIDWPGWSPTWMLGRRFHGKTLGIVGMGRIGIAVARRAKAFGLSVIYHNREPIAEALAIELGATFMPSLDQMLARSDIVSMHCPATPATFHLLSARRIQMLKTGAYVINTARGEVIDELALIKAIESGQIAGAGLDVFSTEDGIGEKLQQLAQQGKVVLLPHMGSATHEARMDMGEQVIINIRTYFDGHRPRDRVLPLRGLARP